MVKGKMYIGVAAFFFLCTWVLSIPSTVLTDWLYLWSTTDGPHEGLWSSCWSNDCWSNNAYDTGCLAMLNSVRAFSIITICMGFFSMLLCIGMFMKGSDLVWYATAAVGFLTMCCSALPWSIYLGFYSECAYPKAEKGAGWGLAIAAFPCAVIGFFAIMGWKCYMDRKKPVEKTAAKSLAPAAAAGAQSPPPKPEPAAPVGQTQPPMGMPQYPTPTPTPYYSPAPTPAGDYYNGPAYYGAPLSPGLITV